jgi:hypothetical protein
MQMQFLTLLGAGFALAAPRECWLPVHPID